MFPLRERATVLRCTYIAYLVIKCGPIIAQVVGYSQTSHRGDPGLIPCHPMSRIRRSKCGPRTGFAPSTSVFPSQFQSSFIYYRRFVVDSVFKKTLLSFCYDMRYNICPIPNIGLPLGSRLIAMTVFWYPVQSSRLISQSLRQIYAKLD